MVPWGRLAWKFLAAGHCVVWSHWAPMHNRRHLLVGSQSPSEKPRLAAAQGPSFSSLLVRCATANTTTTTTTPYCLYTVPAVKKLLVLTAQANSTEFCTSSHLPSGVKYPRAPQPTLLSSYFTSPHFTSVHTSHLASPLWKNRLFQNPPPFNQLPPSSLQLLTPAPLPLYPRPRPAHWLEFDPVGIFTRPPAFTLITGVPPTCTTLPSCNGRSALCR